MVSPKHAAWSCEAQMIDRRITHIIRRHAGQALDSMLCGQAGAADLIFRRDVVQIRKKQAKA